MTAWSVPLLGRGQYVADCRDWRGPDLSWSRLDAAADRDRLILDRGGARAVGDAQRCAETARATPSTCVHRPAIFSKPAQPLIRPWLLAICTRRLGLSTALTRWR